jgi:hypothetical protein
MTALTATTTGWLLGLLLGMRHALEPDHLAAVSTLVLETRSSRRGLWLGALWGIGHSASLLVVGLLLSLLHAELPKWLGRMFEGAVSLMLILLGVRAIGRVRHALAHPHPHRHPSSSRWASRPIVYGVIHGLAGSGALTALVVAELPTTPARLAYISCFGFGSIVGMALLSGIAGWPLARLGRRPWVAAALSAATGTLSAALGAALLWPLATQFFE